ncbi:hypothetical protein [Aestuariivirga sp.]|uniref:hypothetical protein n=1 Tax=Aestuariivirga sp. TaxID=2650926 RepID=UPI00391B28C5
MSRKTHQIAHNDVRFSALPEHTDPMDHGFGAGTTAIKRRAWPRRPQGGSLEAALLADALAVGLYRTRGDAECPNHVRVLSNGCSFFIAEAEYRRRECRPYFEDLPWHGGPDVTSAGGKS